MAAGSQGTPGKQGESAQVTSRDGLSPAVRSGFSSWTAGAPGAVWFCGDAVVFLSADEDVLLALETAASGLDLLSGGRLDDVVDDEEEVVFDPLLEYDLLM